MKLIANWRQAWRFDSVRAALLLAILGGLQADLLPFAQPLLSDKSWSYLNIGFALLIALLRMRAQPGIEDAGSHGGQR